MPPKGINLNVPMSPQFKKVVANPTDSGDPADVQVVITSGCAAAITARGCSGRATRAAHRRVRVAGSSRSRMVPEGGTT